MIYDTEIINDPIMALSWKQPFADMMLHGKIETRLWPTKYRGLVLICASKESYYDNQVEAITGDGYLFKFMQFVKRSENWWQRRVDFEKGKAIAIGRLVDCRPMTPADEKLCLVKYKKPWVETKCRGKHKQFKMVERQLWCHVYSEVYPIRPFDWKGTQGWKKLTENDKLSIDLIIEY